MEKHSSTEEIRIGSHLYGYLLTIGIAGFALFMVVIEPNILRQFRYWISTETLNDLLLSWFAVCVITALYLYFAAMLIQLLRRGTNIRYFFWYYAILAVSLLFATIFYQLAVGPRTTVLFAGLVILITSNVATLFMTAIFFSLHFVNKHNFYPFVIGIMCITTAYTWFYLTFISKLAVM